MDDKEYVERLEREGRELYERMAPYRVSVPMGSSGPWTIAPFDTVLDVHYVLQARDGRPPGIGVHTRLVHDEIGIFMSDTAPEILDLLGCIEGLAGRVLVSGLGLGLVAHILTQVEPYRSRVEAVTVLENDREVLALVAPHYEALDERIEIVEADVLTWTPPAGAHWDSAWHDIWPDLSLENLSQMEEIRKRYVPSVTGGRQYFWGERETRAKRDWDLYQR